ncbi:hypothetical protein J3R83DRAFT_9561 [Lanmaoa asiatica]|nr:hypothetical protein J3R83DRAFT_9561 [Lanmaoa asiatica]
MSRNRRRCEESTSSHWEPWYGRSSYCDEYNRRHYAPPTELLPTRSFNYWRDEAVVPSSYNPQRWERYDEQWRDDGRSWHAESSYSRRRRNFGPGRDWDDRESRRDRSPPPHRNHFRQRHSTYTPSPYILRPTFRARSPAESIPAFPKPVPQDPPRKASPPLNMSPQPLKPSSAYLSLSQQPSEVLRNPGITRKLLVLDLNGTLLIRSARSRASTGPQLRPVQPRPYMQSLRQYLFCPETKAWLDTIGMVLCAATQCG